MSPDSSSRWQFWIDVGGTFTDCLAQDPTGQLHQTKVLSSGLVKGQLEFVDGQLRVEQDAGEAFWDGASLRVLDSQGLVVITARIAKYDSASGAVLLEETQPAGDAASIPLQIEAWNGLAFELDHQVPAPILAIRKLLSFALVNPLPDCDVRLGTTRGTNALLTRGGAKTAFVTTKGFGDLLLIGDQARPSLFELTIRKPEPVFETAIEIDERVFANGTVEIVPDEVFVRSQLEQIKSDGVESIAICLIHGFRFPAHEQMIGDIATDVGFSDVRLSSNVAPLIKMLARAETTVLDAYLNPVLSDYLDQIENRLSTKSQLQLMTSAGGLVSREHFSGKDSVLSGPAGGIVGAARVAEQAGYHRVLTFDMGGTSTDVGRYDGEIELEFETRKSDVRIMTPMVAVETVAAGGGSVCWFDGTKLVVGPQSATSNPGPACYGRGGPLTVTDLNLFLGRMVKKRFPFPLDESAVEKRLTEIASQMSESGFSMTLPELAAGFLTIANHNMAAAIRSVSIARGYDPRDYLLVAFGGAGPQHCCAVADAIGIEKVLDHPQGSILSAVGIRLADQSASKVRSVLDDLNDEVLKKVAVMWREMQLEIQNVFDLDDLEFTQSLDLRYVGTEASQTIQVPSSADGETISASFVEAHQRLFGFVTDRPIEIVAARVEGRKTGVRLDATELTKKAVRRRSETHQLVWQCDSKSEKFVQKPIEVFDRESLKPTEQVIGPAIIAGSLSSTLVDDGWDATMLADGQLLLQKIAETEARDLPRSNAKATTVDPVRLEIFNRNFASIAKQMGIALQKTSMSVNVKERLDFSCAIFTSIGDLVVNAPHIPVHLGAMSETVRAIIRLNENFHPGDVFVTNDPFAGGSHLPDVTVLTPVFNTTGDELIFWVASRSHHSEIGGISPGSMPSNATNLAEEGVLIRNFKLVDGKTGESFFDSLFDLLTASPYPSRSPQENLADIRAQVAANRSGERDLLRLVEQSSQEVVLDYTGFIQSAAEQKIRTALRQMNDGEFLFEDSLDNGATIRVRVSKLEDQLTIDFTGTDSVLKGNLNANPAIVSSAVIYVMRCLVDEDIPLNEGVMKPVQVILPTCFLNPVSHKDPAKCPAVVGGNVETSQRVVDVLLGAIQQSVPGGLAAASQGTMNNWLMGDETFGYYETVGGGAGATSVAGGADAVHTHMTNTRLTDPEVLETRYPVVLREFAIRKNSGGLGTNVGGDGLIREVEFARRLTVSLLTNRRDEGPYGINGGGRGAPGVNQLIRSGESRVDCDGGVERLPSSCEIEVEPGDRLRIETPGGGGFLKS